MLSNQEVEARFNTLDGVHYVKVDGDGYKYQITIVSDLFSNKSKVARQQWVYAQVKELITSGMLHALTINTWTIKEWGEQQNG
ncbi:MAG: BolA family transcriptional regulator [Legionella sp.]|nr:MAG: BolA family transcriptional regulator [Legionella sp.]PJD99594.1 MAG: BolA family transcriptional regulator [Legionella sp.]